MKNKGLYIFGYSGHAMVALDIAIENGLTPVGYFDVKKATRNLHNIEYFGNETEVVLKEIIGKEIAFPTVGDNSIRKKIIKFIEKETIEQTNLIASTASISKFAQLGKSIMVAPNAVINSQAEIAKGVIINSGAIVEHECQIGAFTHIAPGAVLTGNVRIGESCLIGANALIKPGLAIANHCIIGAGAVVVQNITKAGTWVGNPAKKIK